MILNWMNPQSGRACKGCNATTVLICIESFVRGTPNIPTRCIVLYNDAERMFNFQISLDCRSCLVSDWLLLGSRAEWLTWRLQ